MRIGFVGTHRTGKTTLAGAVSERLKIEQIKSPVSAIAKSFGFNMDTDRRDTPRFTQMQKEILVTLASSFANKSRFVSDRTPLDAAAYLLCDVQANNGSEEWRELVLDYTSKAIAATETFFDAVVLVQPGILFDAQDGKPGPNPAYQEHMNLVCAGLVSQLDIPAASIPRGCTDPQERLNLVVEMATAVQTQRASNLGLVGF
jgi:hypothetical protein